MKHMVQKWVSENTFKGLEGMLADFTPHSIYTKPIFLIYDDGLPEGRDCCHCTPMEHKDAVVTQQMLPTR